MKVTTKLFLVALLLSLILSVGAVTAQDNITFEKSDMQDISTEIISQDNEQSTHDEILKENNEDSKLKEDIAVSYQFSDIQSWINSASEGETIYLNGEFYSGSGSPINVAKNNITIIGGPQYNPNSIATLDAHGISSIMTISASNVVIQGIKFINGHAPLIHNGNSLDETDCGAMDISGSNCKIISCSFINNDATNDAGAIKISGYTANNIIEDCVFEQNHARNGGAILTWGENVSILNSNFTNNYGSSAGAIESYGKNAFLDNCNFINSHVDYDGGTVRVSGFNSTIINSNFINSSCNREGGAIYIGGDNITVKCNKFIDCYSKRYGGAIYINKNNIVVENNRFLNSTADEKGDDIFIRGANDYILNNSFYVKPMSVYEDNPGNAIIENNRNVDSYTVDINSSFVGFVARTVQIPIYVTDIWDTPMSGTVTLYGYGDQTLVDGKAMFVVNLPSTPTILKSYVKYGDTIKNITIESVAFDSIESIVQNSADDIIVNLASGAAGNVIVNINGVNYVADVVNGTATVRPEGLVNGEYVAIIMYSGDGNFSSEWRIASINITQSPEKVESYSINVNSSFVGFVARTVQIPIYVTDIWDTPMSGTVTLYGYGDQTLVDGKAMFVVNLPSTPTILKSYVKYGDTIKNITIESVAFDSIESIVQNSADDIIVNLASGAAGNVIVNINGVNYVADVVNGTATVRPEGLVNGEYVAIIMYSGDDEYSNEWRITSINITQSPVYKLTQGKDINVLYSGKATYKVLVTKDGKPVAGENVIIGFNGKNNNVRTDANGYATLNLDTGIKPGSYYIKTTYNGVSATNRVIVKQIIKASDKKVKKSAKLTKVKISLVKVDGKYLKSKTLKVKFNGKTYKVKTNSKGVATWKVKKSMLKKLKVNKKYKYTVNYGSDTLTKKLTVKK